MRYKIALAAYLLAAADPLATRFGGTGTASITCTTGQRLTSTGTPPVYSCSSLVAADIPNLDASKITTGTLPAARGGTDNSSAADDNVLVGSGSAWVPTSIPNCTGAANALLYNTGTNTFTCNTITGSGIGSVTSVAETPTAEFTVAGSPITGSGTFTWSKANQSANTVWAGPTSGGAAAPAFRALVTADFPALRYPTDGNDVLVYKFDESAAPFASTGSLNTNLTLATGSISYLRYTSPVGLASIYLNQNGVNTALKATTDPAMETSTFTLSAWMNARIATSGCTLFGKGYRVGSGVSPHFSIGIQFAMSTSGSQWDVFVRNSGAYREITNGDEGDWISPQVWHHVGLTYDSTTLKYYVDGALSKSLGSGGAMDWGTHGPVMVGGDTENAANYGCGLGISDFRYANVVRDLTWFKNVYSYAMRHP